MESGAVRSDPPPVLTQDVLAFDPIQGIECVAGSQVPPCLATPVKRKLPARQTVCRNLDRLCRRMEDDIAHLRVASIEDLWWERRARRRPLFDRRTSVEEICPIGH